ATGKWFYGAIAALSGVMLIFEFHLLTLILILIGFIRIILEKEKKLFVFFSAFFIVFFVLAFINEKNNISLFDQGNTSMDVTFLEVPQIDGNRLKAVVNSTNEKLLLQYTIQNEEEKLLLERNIKAGTTCQIAGELVVPERNRNEYAFNYKQYLYRQNRSEEHTSEL